MPTIIEVEYKNKSKSRYFVRRNYESGIKLSSTEKGLEGVVDIMLESTNPLKIKFPKTNKNQISIEKKKMLWDIAALHNKLYEIKEISR